MRCCSGITWRNCQRITQIMSLLIVSTSTSFFIAIYCCWPYCSVYKYACSEWTCVTFGSSLCFHKVPVCLRWVILSLMRRLNFPVSHPAESLQTISMAATHSNSAIHRAVGDHYIPHIHLIFCFTYGWYYWKCYCCRVMVVVVTD